MNKFFTSILVIAFTVSLVGCGSSAPSPQDPINGDANGNINDNVYPNTTTGTGYNTTTDYGTGYDTTGTDYTTGTGTGYTTDTTGTGYDTTTGYTSSTSTNTPYATSLGDIDGTLRKSLTDMDLVKLNATDKNYLPSSVDYYTRRANAYRTALDSLNKLSVGTTSKAYNDTIASYYQNGYDTYNNLATKYGTFKTVNDETAYKSGLGKTAYDVKTDLRSAYDKALNSLGIATTTTNKTATTAR